jgi:hypothetical protein
MTNFIPEIVNEVLDDIKENIDNHQMEKLNINCRYFILSMNFEFYLFFLAEQSKINLLEKKLLLSNNDDQTESTPLILMNKQIELIHPIEHQWSFWYLKNQQGKDWQENLMKLATFGYVEEFWA